MEPKAIISLFLAVVLACTILPVRQVGQLLSSNQIQEEIPHNMDSGKSLGKEFGKSILFYHEFADLSSSIFLSGLTYCPISVSLPDYFVGEIQTPPPNAA